jgi:hypothetical protein
MEENGKASSGRRTRHINIRYFFIADRVAKKEVSIIYCPTKLMVADYFTKPLQGALFYKFRDQILDVVPMDDADHRSVLDDKVSPVSPKTPITPKRKISPIVKTKKTKVAHGSHRPVLRATHHGPKWSEKESGASASLSRSD